MTREGSMSDSCMDDVRESVWVWDLGVSVVGGMFFFVMIRRPPRSTQSRSSAASDVYKRQAPASLPGRSPSHAGRPASPDGRGAPG